MKKDPSYLHKLHRKEITKKMKDNLILETVESMVGQDNSILASFRGGWVCVASMFLPMSEGPVRGPG